MSDFRNPEAVDNADVSARGGSAASSGAPSPERPMNEREKDAVKVASTPATAAAGAVAGAAAGMATGLFGPIGSIVGAIVGALGGAAAGAAHATAADDLYTAEHDAYYQSVWESSADRPADRTFEFARPAYQFGHVAARYPGYAGRDFAAVEPELRQRWPEEFRTHAGEWDAVRRYVETGYSYSRRQWLAAQRDTSVVGSAGSAVNPEELARAQSGLPSVDDGTPAATWGDTPPAPAASPGRTATSSDAVSLGDLAREDGPRK